MKSGSHAFAATTVEIPARRSSFTSRSCKVANARSTRPFACGLLAQMMSMFSSDSGSASPCESRCGRSHRRSRPDRLTPGKHGLAVRQLSWQGGETAMGTWGHGTAPERPLDLAPERFSRTGRPAYAIIDIGSNSVRLVVYDEIGRAPFPRFNEKALCQLGDGFARTGALTPDGVARTLAALRRFRAIADAMAVERIDTLATEAVRQASNGPELVAQIAGQTGLSARVLSGEEEAYFGA